MSIRYYGRFFALLFCLSLPVMVSAQRQAKTIPARPSLESLVARVDSYWKLVQVKKKLAAAEYVIPSHREEFVARFIPDFSDPRISSLALSPDRNSVKVTVSVQREFPGQTMKWLVTENWVFEAGTWYLEPETLLLPMSNGAPVNPSLPNAEQKEKLQRELREMLRLENQSLNFGTVRQGAPATAMLKYTLSGNDSLPIDIDRTRPGLKLFGLRDRTLVPGKSRELAIEVSTLDYEGAVNERVALLVSRQGVDLPFEIEVRGNIYVPISLTPKILFFRQNEQDKEKELLVRNNTKQQVELKSVFSETNALVIEPLPATILPGQQLLLKFRKIADVSNANLRDNISISLTKAADGMGSINIPVIFNYLEPKRHEPEQPDEPKEIQELLRKNQVNEPNR
jgi:hypothetical protein